LHYALLHSNHEQFRWKRGMRMSWLRIGDTASMHPVVLRSLELPNATESLKLELFGFVAMAATMCAAHEGDSIIELGTIFQVAGVARGKQLAAAAEYCGYFEQIKNQQTGAIAYKLIEDPELIHMVSKEQREWANQQRNDTRDSKLVVPIRERDGDACRWCGHVVYWNDKRGARGGTYDHLYPGVAAKSPDDMVVSCRGCNSSRKDSQNSDNDLSQLLPAPQNPWYSDATANFLNEHANLMRTHNHVLPSAKKDKPRGKPKAPPPGSSEPPGSSVSTAPPPAWVAVEENQINMFIADIESSVGERVDAPGAGAPVERPIDPVESEGQSLNTVDLANTGKFLQKATPTDLVTPGRVGSVRVGDPAQAGNLCAKEKSTVRRKRGKRCRKKG
jgi:hypothetical protein